MVNCSVSSCNRRSATSNLRNHGISYHIFPKNPILREKWKIFCGQIESWSPTRTSVICSEHFTSDSFEILSNNRRKLIEGAIPTSRSAQCMKEPVAKIRISISTTRTAHAEVTEIIPLPLLAIETPSTLPTSSSLSQSFAKPSTSHSQSIDQPSTTITVNTEPIESPRLRKLRTQLQFKNKKIRRLQAKNRYLKKKVSTLEELLNNLEEKSLIDMED